MGDDSALPAEPATATPAQIDAAWLPIEARAAEASARISSALRMADGAAAYPHQAHRYTALADRYRAAQAECEAEAAPYRAEWQRRGGWRRYYLVQASGGHFHSSTQCSSCFPTTRFSVVPTTSGLNSEELVDLVGHHACTICFPDAPTHPAWVRTQQEEARAQQARATQRAAAQRAKLSHSLDLAERRLERAVARGAARFELRYLTEDVDERRHRMARFDRKHGPLADESGPAAEAPAAPVIEDLLAMAVPDTPAPVVR